MATNNIYALDPETVKKEQLVDLLSINSKETAGKNKPELLKLAKTFLEEKKCTATVNRYSRFGFY